MVLRSRFKIVIIKFTLWLLTFSILLVIIIFVRSCCVAACCLPVLRRLGSQT